MTANKQEVIRIMLKSTIPLVLSQDAWSDIDYIMKEIGCNVRGVTQFTYQAILKELVDEEIIVCDRLNTADGIMGIHDPIFKLPEVKDEA